MSETEDVLEPGIHNIVGDKEIPLFPDYGEEISSFLGEKGDRKDELPFVNQDNSLLRVLRILRSDYPYAVLIGSPGIGKSMMLDYLVGVLTGERKLDEVRKVLPDAVPLFESVRSNFKRFMRRDYLLLPNMADPLNVKTIPYTEPEKASADLEVISSFCEDLSSVFSAYSVYGADRIRRSMTEEQFEQFVKSRVEDIFIHFYESVIEIKAEVGCSSSLENSLFLLDIRAPKRVGSQLKGKWDIETESGRWDARCNYLKHLSGLEKGANKTNVQKKLNNRGINRFAGTRYRHLVSDVKLSDVDDLEDGEIEEKFLRIFEEKTREIYTGLRRMHQEGTIATNVDALLYLKRNRTPYAHKILASVRSVDELVGSVKAVQEKYEKDKCSPEARAWIDSVCEYFTTERKVVKEALERIIKKSDEARRRISKEQHKQKVRERERKNEGDVKFEIIHGRVLVPVEDILKPNYLEAGSSERNRMSCTKITDSDRNQVFGHLEEYNPSYDDNNVPHMLFKELGSFFASSILLFPDSFSDFVEMVTSSSRDSKEGESGMKEQFLEYLQTGIITLSGGGVTYRMEAPHIILASDNDDPFITLKHGGVHKKNELGLRSRIELIDVPDVIRNEAKARRGTIRVIYDTLDSINAKNGNRFDLKPDVANALLTSTTCNLGLHLDMSYRDLVKKIENICAYAQSKGTNTIDMNLLMARKRDNQHPEIFLRPDLEDRYGGYFDSPEKMIGLVNGLSYAGEGMPGPRMRVKSYFVPGLSTERRNAPFTVMAEIGSALVDEATIKGFGLASDFVKTLISQAGVTKNMLAKQGDWQLKTHYKGDYDKSGGPSSSTAIAISMVSALAADEIYRNRFITGTMDPDSGDIGDVGGVYEKALFVMRLRELSEQRRKPERMYFLLPAGNLSDFSRDLMFDPFGIEGKVCCLPVTNFAQAYHLMTCGLEITRTAYEDSVELGKTKSDIVKGKIKTKFDGD